MSDNNSGVPIAGAVKINGNGHSIDGDSISRAFIIYGDNVVLSNIVFKNCYFEAS